MDKTYIVLPVNDAKTRRRYFIRRNGELLNDFDAALDFDTPAYDIYMDVTRFAGSAFTLTDEDGNEIPYRTAQQFPDVDQIRNGRYLRPAAHFTSRIGWNNDPNGLVYVNGRYHMFYQHNPAGWNWGNMTWGHAVSRDLVHWEELGDTLFPDEMGTMFSGSGICDGNNVAGFGKGAILLFYTAAGNSSALSEGAPCTQCLAYSTDDGKTFTKYDKNPIIPHIMSGNRDPKVQWSDELGRFTLSLYLDSNDYRVFVSDNLLDWEKLFDIHMPDDNECPDFYPLTVNGEVRWVFSGAHDTYQIGEMKDGTFVPCQEALPYHIGPGVSYAAQTFSGTGDRRIKIAWGQNSAPGAVFNSQMSVPMEMFLRRVGDVIRLGSLPVREVELLKKRSLGSAEFAGTGEMRLGTETDGAVDVTLEIGEDCGAFTLSCFGMEIRVSPSEGAYSHGNCRAPLTYDGKRNMRVIFDTLGAEIFADDGLIYSTMPAIADRTKPLAVSSAEKVSLKITADVLSME